MGSKQRGRKGSQGFGNARPVKPLRKPQGKEQAPQELTARRRFLAKMEQLVPWARLLAVLQPFYPQVGPQGGRPPYPLEVMLRIHLLQLWNSRSDQGTQDDLLDIIPFRAFSKIDELAQGQAPDATTILRFRHFLEEYDLARKLFEEVVEQLEAAGLLMRQGSIVDSSHIQAPCSTKNKERKRDPEMHQSRKGNQWFFGMKWHVGVDKDSGLIHSMTATAGNVSDVTVAAELLHGQEEVLYGDAGYQGLENREEMAGKQVECRIAMRPGKRRQLPDTPEGHLQELCEKAKAHIRAKVEHVFRVLKQQLGFSKTRLRGLKKNRSRLFVLAASINLFSARRHLLAATG